MKVNIIASGSSGNCIALQSGKTSILIDVGLPKTKVEHRLIEHNVDPTSIKAIFLTHAHGDHTKGLPLANKYRIPVYASEGTWKTVDSVERELRYIMQKGSPILIDGAFEITAFGTYHDDYDSFGFTVREKDSFGDKVAICLDTGKVDDSMIEVMKGSDVIIIESNHEPALVEACDRPDIVKARILSDVGHLSNEQTAAALQKIVEGKGERIYLTHLSSNNNDPETARATVQRALLKKRLQAGNHYEIEVI